MEFKLATNVYNLVINQGATWELIVEYKNQNGQAIPLTGYTAKMQLRVSPLSAIADLTLSSGTEGGIVIDSETGTLNITATATQTANLEPQRYTYDLKISNAVTGDAQRLIEGVINVSPETTR